jgi:hypothetical protein
MEAFMDHVMEAAMPGVDEIAELTPEQLAEVGGGYPPDPCKL